MAISSPGLLKPTLEQHIPVRNKEVDSAQRLLVGDDDGRARAEWIAGTLRLAVEAARAAVEVRAGEGAAGDAEQGVVGAVGQAVSGGAAVVVGFEELIIFAAIEIA